MHNRIILKTDDDILYISLSEIEDDFQSNLHSHPNIEVLLFIDGKGYIQTTTDKIPVQKSDVIIINKKCNHVETSSGLKFYALGINNVSMYLEDIFTNNFIHYTLTSSEYETFHTLYKLIYQENLIKHNHSKQITRNSVDTIFLLLANKYNILLKNTIKSKSESDLVSNIKQIIENYYYQDFDLDDISNRLSQSKSTICHEFKKNTGMSIIQYRIKKQLEESQNLLSITDMSISQIASLVGFDSTSYFTKIFKQKYGITPKEFKKRLTNDESKMDLG